ncbi:DNA mismatch repair protein pms1 [Wickerhamiella sorbophila]|uniref:DNA mismatch repair protein pms1 n=1 Tax=Wickerhamiella sorbophila TaxID=45607 RepID=A0A2T0FMR6_9ASCO|nr:DNA mismatch repair protein pms1 [Wickerhamiella sorbophila]PRT56270.1 DNA mismatch repair protein pms1 [Wickerhamiella sorbophila]
MITAIDQRSIDQITAGKVVVTLAMAVKELVENSIDSGASSISIQLDNYGLDGFSVTDNGSGIDEQDFELVARKYTTSKLKSFEDLDSIETLGFRGEALGSLCAMARVEITTNTQPAKSGHTLIFNEDGGILEKRVSPSPKGTTVKITDLFRTAPVRRKDFERHYKNEYTKMVNLIQAYALVCPIKLQVENNTKGRKIAAIQSQGETMDKRIAAVFGISALKGLVPVNLKTRVFDLEGYISEPVFGKGRSGTDRQLLYVNSRPATLPKVQKTINAAYQLSNSTEYPFFVLNLRLDPHTFDVNLSADKRTLLLHDESAILENLQISLGEFFDSSGHNVPRSSRPMPKRPKTTLELERFASAGSETARGEPETEIHIRTDRLSTRSRRSAAPDMALTGFISAAELPQARSFELASNPAPKPSAPTPFNARKRSASPSNPAPILSSRRKDHTVVPETSDALDRIFDQAGHVPNTPLAQSTSAQTRSENVSSDHAGSVPDTPIAQNTSAQVTPKAVTNELPAKEERRTTPKTTDQAHISPPPKQPKELDVLESLNVANEPPKSSGSQFGKTLNTHVLLTTSIDDVQSSYDLLKPHEKNEILNHSIEESAAEERLNLTVRKEDFAKMRVVGQFNKGFILVVKSDSHGQNDLFVIDQHASDEIFNFERLQSELQMNCQPLVQPRPLELSPVEELTVINHLNIFENNGFSISIVPDAPLGKQCQLTALPYSKNWVFGEKDVHDLICKIQENPSDKSIKCSSLRAMIAMRACRSSIMIGKSLSFSTMARVVSNLGTLNRPWNCPHGRPTLRHITSLT